MTGTDRVRKGYWRDRSRPGRDVQEFRRAAIRRSGSPRNLPKREFLQLGRKSQWVAEPLRPPLITGHWPTRGARTAASVTSAVRNRPNILTLGRQLPVRLLRSVQHPLSRFSRRIPAGRSLRASWCRRSWARTSWVCCVTTTRTTPCSPPRSNTGLKRSRRSAWPATSRWSRPHAYAVTLKALAAAKTTEAGARPHWGAGCS